MNRHPESNIFKHLVLGVTCIVALFSGNARAEHQPRYPALRRSDSFRARGGLVSPFFRKDYDPPSTQPSTHSHALSKKVAENHTLQAGTGTASIELTIATGSETDYSHYSVELIDTFGYSPASSYLPLGLVTFQGVHPGTYTIALGTGSSRRYLGGNDHIGQAQWIVVEDGQALSGYTISRPAENPTSPDSKTISGIVFLDGEPASNHRFDISFLVPGQSYPENSIYGYTAHNGVFSETSAIPDGEYYVLIKGDRSIPQWWDGSEYTANPQLVTLNGDITGKEIRLETGASISGSIRIGGSPSANYISIECIDSQGFVVQRAYVEPNDTTYAIRGLPAATFILKIRRTVSSSPVYYRSTTDPDLAEPITLSKGQNARVNIEITEVSAPSMGFVAGSTMVDGSFLAVGAFPVLHYDDESLNTNSSFEFTGGFTERVRAGKPFRLQVEPVSGYYLAPTWYAGELSEDDATTLTVAENETLSVDIDLQRGGSAAGFISDQYGNPLPLDPDSCVLLGTIIYDAADSNIVSFSEITRTSGFRLTGLPAGNYYGRIYYAVADTCTNAIASTPVPGFSVQTDQTTVIPPVTMETGNGSISGTVQGNGNAGFMVVYCLNEQGELVSFSFLQPSSSDPGRVREALLSSDYGMRNALLEEPYSITALQPGRYYLAFYDASWQANSPIRWYGTSTTTSPTSVVPVPPPDADLVTVGEGEEIAIDLSSSHRSKVQRLNVPGPLNLTVCNTPAGLRLAYDLGQELAPEASLSVYNCRGQCLFSRKLTQPRDIIVWEDSPRSMNPISAGAVIVALTNGSTRKATRVFLPN